MLRQTDIKGIVRSRRERGMNRSDDLRLYLLILLG